MGASYGSRRTKIAVGLVVFLYIVFTQLKAPRGVYRTEFNSGKVQLQRELETHSNWRTHGLNFQPSKKANLPIDSTVREQLAFQFPYEPKKGFQKNIWQTWKVPLDHKDFPPRYKRYLESWETNNPGFKHYVIPDEQCEELIRKLYETVPDVARAYAIMPKLILKADFFRYLILFARGGVYSDIDTKALKPIETWISLNATFHDKPNPAGLVVGIEADPDRPDWAEWYARRIQFCQWTIQAKKGHPMLRELVAKITDITLTREKNHQLRKVLGKDEGGDIMNWTGPGIWTDEVFRYMNNILQTPEAFKLKKYDDIVTWKMFTGIQAPIAVDDVMVLPITSFSPDVNQMGAKSMTDPMAYAKHMFLGSWKHDDKNLPNDAEET